MRCAYLVRCIDCTDCTYCFGCVGLSKRDFYILNVAYDRQTYFARVAELEKGLRSAPISEGHAARRAAR
jgi:hypothetical protein